MIVFLPSCSLNLAVLVLISAYSSSQPPTHSQPGIVLFGQNWTFLSKAVINLEIKTLDFFLDLNPINHGDYLILF